jgi:hypothetical protein
MKLSTMRIQQALDQFGSDTAVIPESHPKAGELEDIFGAHTFFLDKEGLEIIEPVAAREATQKLEEVGQVIRVAMWNDAARTTLAAAAPETTGVVVVFPSEA